MNESVARKAAAWWANQLKDNAKLDNGDDSENSAMVLGLALMLQNAEKEGQSPEQIERFENELFKLIMELEPMFLSVDYHPGHILSTAAELAGLPLGMTSLPWKTSMMIKDDVVSVSCGYRADRVEI